MYEIAPPFFFFKPQVHKSISDSATERFLAGPCKSTGSCQGFRSRQTRDDGKPRGRGAGRARGRGRGKGRGRGRGRKKVSEEDVDDPDLKDLDKEDEEIKRELADEQGSDDEARK